MKIATITAEDNVITVIYDGRLDMKYTARHYRKLLGTLALAFAIVLGGAGYAQASFTSVATNWNNFNSPTGFTIPYTFNGQPVSDHEGSSDPTNGGTGVQPANVDLASGSPAAAPGPYDTPSYGYYDGGTPYDKDDPSTMNDDFIRFTMRLTATPAKQTHYDAYHWNILFDVDGDGYKEYWIDLDGAYGAQNGDYDRISILYDDRNDQELPGDPDKTNPVDYTYLRVDQFVAFNYTDTNNYSHTRVRAAGDGTGDYFIDFQVPMTAFKDYYGNQVLYPNTPVGFVFSTSASNTDPLQKDFMADLNFLTQNDPISFGDIVTSNGDPILYFTDSAKEHVDFYYVGDDVYLYLRYVFGNTSDTTVDTLTVYVADPITGDEEVVTVTETGPNTGIFTNQGGASKPAATNPSVNWVAYVETSVIATSADWRVTYVSAGAGWTVCYSTNNWLSQTCEATNAFGDSTYPYTKYTTADSSISFSLYQNGTPTAGDRISFTTYAGDRLQSSSTSNADDNGTLFTISGHDILYTFMRDGVTPYTDEAIMLGPGTPFIRFTRSEGTTVSTYDLNTDTALSDKLYVTLCHYDANTNSGTVQTITVALTGTSGDTQTLTLTETGPDTGVFRNTTGLSTKVSDGTITGADNLWEDIDLAWATATYTYSGTPYATTAQLFSTTDGGRINFTNGAGTVGIETYYHDNPIFVRVDDVVVAGGACTITTEGGVKYREVTLTADTGDTRTIRVYETVTNSNVYVNRRNDLVTTASSATVTSALSDFVTEGVVAGDKFVIANGPDAGDYTVLTRNSATSITLTTSLTSTRTGVGFTASPILARTYDGAYSTTDDLMEAVNLDTITAAYTDCNDGDLNGTNNTKYDYAVYKNPPIVINEVLFYPKYDAALDHDEQEYIQLYNNSTTNENVTGYYVRDEDGYTYTIPQYGGSDIMLQPGEKIYIIQVADTSGTQNQLSPDYDSTNGIYYFYHLVSTSSAATDTLSDPLDADPADQLTLYDSLGSAVDYVGWSNTSSNTLDFRNDDDSALNAEIWDDNVYRDVTAIVAGSVLRRVSNGYDTNVPADWIYDTASLDKPFIITQAIVSDFAVAPAVSGGLSISWQTVSETGTAGFDLWRYDYATGRHQKVNRQLLPSLAITANEGQGGTETAGKPMPVAAPEGGLYSLIDRSASATGHYTYRIEEVELAGTKQVRGPFEVVASALVEGEPSAPKAKTAPKLYAKVYASVLADGTVQIANEKVAASGTPGGVTVTDASGVPATLNKKPTQPTSSVGYAEDAFTATPRRALEASEVEDKFKAAVNSTATANATARPIGVGKIATQTEGMYFISAAQAASVLGKTEADTKKLIQSTRVVLTSGGVKVPYSVRAADGLTFYAKAVGNNYTAQNVFWLSVGNGLSMRSDPGSLPAPVAGGSFMRTVHAEQDRYSVTSAFFDPSEDIWLWDYISAAQSTMNTKRFTVDAPAAVPGASGAQIAIRFKGVTDAPAEFDHNVKVSVNGIYIGTATFKGLESYVGRFSVPAGVVVAGPNTVEVQGYLATGVPYSFVYVDEIDLKYRSYFTALGDVLAFDATGGVVTVGGFSTQDISVYKVLAGGLRSALITDVTIDADPAGGYRASFVSSAGYRFVAVGATALNAPARIWPDVASTLKSAGNAASYVVITSEALAPAAQTLADYRQARGLSTKVVLLEDIMDEFNYGASNPAAIKQFIEHARSYWSIAPKYVLLMGAGSFDFKNVMGHGDSQVPPMLVATANGLVAADIAYADLNGDHIPDVAIGRMPANTLQQATSMVQKTIAYESATGAGKSTALLLADTKDRDADFAAQSNAIAAILQGKATVKKVHIPSYANISLARAAALGAINQGAGLVNYIGHGGVASLSNQGLVKTADVATMTNTTMPSIFTAMTCVVGNYGIPGYDSLGEALVQKQGSGAAAVWAPAGMNNSGDAQVLNEEFAKAVYHKGARTLGDAILEAMKAYRLRTTHVEQLDVYNLLGDPALGLR